MSSLKGLVGPRLNNQSAAVFRKRVILFVINTTADTEHISSPQALPRLEMPFVLYFGWLLVFLGYEWFRFKLGVLGFPRSFDQIFSFVSAIECVEFFVLLRLLLSSKETAGPTIAGAFATLSGLAGVLLLCDDKPILGAAVISAFILFKCWRSPATRAFAVGQFLFVMQYIGQGWPFLYLHNIVGAADASIIRSVISHAGLDVSGYGTYVARPSLHVIFDVMWGCATSTTLAMVIPGFLIAVLGLRGQLKRSDFLWLGALIGVTAFCNWIRLTLIVRSLEAHAYWHDGDGAQLFGFFYAVLIMATAYLAAQSRTTSGAA